MIDGFFTVPRERFGCPDLNSIVAMDNDLPDPVGFEPIVDEKGNPVELAAEDTSNSDVTEATTTTRSVVVDRTVAVSCFPKDVMKITAFDDDDIIGPDSSEFDIGDLVRIATECTSRKELTTMYEAGLRDGERWCRRNQSQKQKENETMRRNRQDQVSTASS